MQYLSAVMDNIFRTKSTNQDESPKYSQKVIGYDIEFPFPPYGIQRAMMSKLSATLTNKEHFLLESPTGTGKTLVLLCSALAWQKKSKQISQPLMSKKLREEKSRERLEKLMNRPCSCGRRPNAAKSEYDELKESKCKKNQKCADYDNEDDEFASVKRVKTEDPSELKSSPYFNKNKAKTSEPDCIIIDDDDDEDGDKALVQNRKAAKVTSCNDDEVCEIIDDDIDEIKRKIHAQDVMPSENLNDECTNQKKESVDKDMCRSCEAIESEKKFADIIGDSAHDGEGIISSKIKARIPRIYYGTRTHKQITQVVRELNKTSYKKNLRMCILSARERACINTEVRDLPNRNDKCQELIKSKPDNSMSKSKSRKADGCPYYQDSNYVAAEFEQINFEYEDEAWDIENAAEFGRSRRICPYYGIRSLQEQADITFCPYNYLLDPNIRKAMNVNLSNAVVIFDEAHNIEDICRDSASFLIDTFQIDEIVETIRVVCTHFVQGSVIMDAYQYFKNRLLDLSSSLRKYVFDENDSERGGDFLKKKVMSGNLMVSFMEQVELGPSNLQKIKENAKALKGDDDDSGDKSKSNNNTQQPVLSFAQQQFIDQLCLTLEFMYANNNKNLPHFRLVVTQALDRGPTRRNNAPLSTVSSDGQGTRDKYVYKLHLLCMSPGIAFEKIHSLAWSVIVASGTLSPTESLKSELGCKFTNVFEGSHVINSDRIFASVLSYGPSKKVDLKCSYQETLRLDFQDEVGAILRDVCQRVPNGVLCFFPSYERLESFYQRWHTTKIMAQIQSRKKVFREQRNQSASKFEEELTKYNDHAKKRGALLFAVFRGKVSEGIDFADKAARAVVTIGIPYPSFGELTIGLKKDYNDTMRSNNPYLMTGGDWYAAQAFRALNQALGRCIRHKDDWGAIIMIDSRLRYDASMKNISKWLQRVINRNIEDYTVTRDRLEGFVEKKNNEDNGILEVDNDYDD